jgi:hypothetical protein
MDACLELPFEDVQELVARPQNVHHFDRRRNRHSAELLQTAPMAGAGRVRSAGREV